MSRHTSIHYYLYSAAVYAFLPVLIALSGLGENTKLNTAAICAGLVLQSVVYYIWRKKEVARAKEATSKRPVFILSLCVINAVAYALSVVFLIAAMHDSNAKISTVIIVESWPIFNAVLLPFILKSKQSKAGVYELSLFVMALIGLVILAYDNTSGKQVEFDMFTLAQQDIYAGLSLVFMVLSTLAKAKCTEYLQEVSSLSAYAAQFLFQTFYIIPCVALALYGLNTTDNVAAYAATLAQNAHWILAVCSAVWLTSALYTLANISQSSSTDHLVWFFAPIITALIMVVLQLDTLTENAVLGGILIVASNLFLPLPC